MASARPRLVAPFALAALSVVAALSLARVVDSGRFVLPVVGAALLPHALGALVRWRGWPVWTGVLLSLLRARGVLSWLALEPSTTTLGIPTGDTWQALDHQLTGGWHLLRTAPAPAPTTDGAILLAVLAVWTMAAIADWLAFAPPGDRSARHLAGARVLRVDVDPRHRRLASRPHHRVLRRAPARSSSRRTSRCSTAGATGSCRSTPLVPTGWHRRRCSARAAVVVRLGRRAARARGRLRSAARRRQHRPRRLGGAAATGRRWRRSSTSARSSTTSRTSRALHRRRISARLLAHRRPRPVLGRRRRPVDAQRRGRRQRAGRAPQRRPGRHPGAAVLHRPARRTVAPRRVPSRSPSISHDTLVVKSSGTLVADADDVTDLDYVVFSKLPPSAGTQFTAAQHRSDGRGRAARRWPRTRRSRRAPTSTRSRRSGPAGRRRSRRHDAVRARRGRCATTSATTPTSSTTPTSAASTAVRPSSSSCAPSTGSACSSPAPTR